MNKTETVEEVWSEEQIFDEINKLRLDVNNLNIYIENRIIEISKRPESRIANIIN